MARVRRLKPTQREGRLPHVPMQGIFRRSASRSGPRVACGVRGESVHEEQSVPRLCRPGNMINAHQSESSL
jgi:hypothetical protein